MISGQQVHEVAALLGLPSFTIMGAHGWEEKKPGRPTHAHPLEPVQERRLERTKRGAAFLCDPGKIGPKAASVTVHTRGMDAANAEKVKSELKTVWSKLEVENDLEIRLFNGGIELRAVGWDKGRALATLMEDSRPNTNFVYIGGDQTDEDAFGAVRGRGMGIRVGPEDSSSRATGYLKNCEAVAAFLDSWLEILGCENKKGF